MWRRWPISCRLTLISQSNCPSPTDSSNWLRRATTYRFASPGNRLRAGGQETGFVRRTLCATPEYFERRGLLLTPADLVNHNCLDYTRSGEQGRWRFHGPEGEISVLVTGSLRVDDDEALSQAVLGVGPFRAAANVHCRQGFAGGAIAGRALEYIAVERHVYAMYLPTRHLPSKVRVFIDFLLERIGENPYWDRENGND